jgi:hypothetical protein
MSQIKKNSGPDSHSGPCRSALPQSLGVSLQVRAFVLMGKFVTYG